MQPTPVLTMTQQRKVACSFRDLSLLQIFHISLTSLVQLKNDGIIFKHFFSWYLHYSCMRVPLNLPIHPLPSGTHTRTHTKERNEPERKNTTVFYSSSAHFWKCSWQQCTGAGYVFSSQMSIIWFYGDIAWWKFRRVWLYSGDLCSHLVLISLALL